MAHLAVSAPEAARGVLHGAEGADDAVAVFRADIDAEGGEARETPVDYPGAGGVEGDHVCGEFAGFVAGEAGLEEGGVGGAVEDWEGVFGVGEEAEAGGGGGLLVAGGLGGVEVAEDGGGGEEGRGRRGHLRGRRRDVGVGGVVGVVGRGGRGGGGRRGRGELLEAEGGVEEGGELRGGGGRFSHGWCWCWCCGRVSREDDPRAEPWIADVHLFVRGGHKGGYSWVWGGGCYYIYIYICICLVLWGGGCFLVFCFFLFLFFSLSVTAVASAVLVWGGGVE